MSRRMRKYHHLTCSNCRRRKTKCDGTEPICKTCQGFGDDTCSYDKPASIAYVRHLEKQIQSLTKEMEGQYPDTQSTPDQKQTLPSQYGITEHDLQMASQELSSVNISLEDQRYHLINMAILSSKLEIYALDKALRGPLAKLDLDTATQLLSYFWSWIHPYHMHIYRPNFFRHMALERSFDESNPSECYSLSLLCLMMGESARILAGQDSEIYKLLSDLGLRLLLEDLKRPPTLAYISGAILFSMRAAATGKRSISWLFSGIAFRASQYLSLENIQPTADNSIEYLEARARTGYYLTHFDVIISLYFGSTPTWIDQQQLTYELLDDSSDHIMWAANDTKHVSKESYYVQTFKWQRAISHETSNLLLKLRIRKSVDEMIQFVNESISTLHTLWQALPRNLNYQEDTLPLPHIVVLALQHYAIRGILYVHLVHRFPLMSGKYIASILELVEQIRICVNTFRISYGPSFQMSFYLNYSIQLAKQLLQLCTAAPSSMRVTEAINFFDQILQECHMDQPFCEAATLFSLESQSSTEGMVVEQEPKQAPLPSATWLPPRDTLLEQLSTQTDWDATSSYSSQSMHGEIARAHSTGITPPIHPAAESMVYLPQLQPTNPHRSIELFQNGQFNQTPTNLLHRSVSHSGLPLENSWLYDQPGEQQRQDKHRDENGWFQ